ncbi:hypothetical protein N7478_011935 [Penicillium angulare]|uniref:uncharacterized protein n=1 Tax=Penicillium angulare TaxID=116970 RepID=UPI00254017F5|nr:uncharacterized protein N7478_011935 [Penicillium angulare]KAJ5261340.1 hypothetical protein N7478_011935 [Penicillium angulare]
MAPINRWFKWPPVARNEDLNRAYDAFSFATTILRATRRDQPSVVADIRVYIQVPYEGTEHDSPQSRAQQAETFSPNELKAYTIMSGDHETCHFTPKLIGYAEESQGPNGLVPGGFLITIAWQRVSGIRLGSGIIGPYSTSTLGAQSSTTRGSPGPFWYQLRKLVELGVIPLQKGTRHLVFNKTTEELYWVGWYNASLKRGVKVNNAWLAIYKLAKPSKGDSSWMTDNWPRDISKWTF